MLSRVSGFEISKIDHFNFKPLLRTISNNITALSVSNKFQANDQSFNQSRTCQMFVVDKVYQYFKSYLVSTLKIRFHFIYCFIEMQRVFSTRARAIGIGYAICPGLQYCDISFTRNCFVSFNILECKSLAYLSCEISYFFYKI